MPDEFPHKHGPEIVHEHLWDECERDIAATQKELIKISEQCAISCEIEAFSAQVSVYGALASDATTQSATNDSGIGSITLINNDQAGSIGDMSGGLVQQLAMVKSDLNDAKVVATQAETKIEGIPTDITGMGLEETLADLKQKQVEMMATYLETQSTVTTNSATWTTKIGAVGTTDTLA